MSIRRVVLIDDDDTVNFINTKLIERANFANEVIAKNAVIGALQYLEDLKNTGELPELIFVDINMPEMDGWDFIDKYQKIDTDHITQIVLLTSLINPIDLERANAHARIRAFREKPVTVELLDEVQVWFS